MITAISVVSWIVGVFGIAFALSNRCRHSWGEMNTSMMQKCSKCGIVRNCNDPCIHDWGLIDKGDLLRYGNTVGKYYIRECKKCKRIDIERAYIA